MKIFSFPYFNRFQNRFNYPKVYIKIRYSNLFDYCFNSIRLKIWTFIARRYKPFFSIYTTSSKADHCSSYFSDFDQSLLRSSSLDSLAEKASIYGVSFFPDFLSPNDHNKVCSEFKCLIKSKASSTMFGDSVVCLNSTASSDIKNIFRCSILNLTQKLLGKPVDVSSVGLQHIFVKEYTDIDENDPNTLLHIDRFIPCLKIFYFPYSIDKFSSPFGFVPFSHKITNRYLVSVKQSYAKRAFEPISFSNLPFEIRNTTQYPEILLEVPNNSLVVSFTNGIHRRVPFSSSNEDSKKSRSSLRFIFYNRFFSHDIIFGAINYSLKSLFLQKRIR